MGYYLFVRFSLGLSFESVAFAPSPNWPNVIFNEKDTFSNSNLFFICHQSARSREQVVKSKMDSLQFGREEPCVICHEDMVHVNNTTQLQCYHVFHSEVCCFTFPRVSSFVSMLILLVLHPLKVSKSNKPQCHVEVPYRARFKSFFLLIFSSKI